ncbi:MAG: hypothetical protein KDC79_11740 [Cyclobacteriaceae bacterium]|nr:hypothetical protein [Cyclobacteriaceae bacterium]
MSEIAKELLLGRIQYLEEMYLRPGSKELDERIVAKVKKLVLDGELTSIMQVESVFNFLVEKQAESDAEIDIYANEIIDFIN